MYTQPPRRPQNRNQCDSDWDYDEFYEAEEISDEEKERREIAAYARLLKTLPEGYDG